MLKKIDTNEGPEPKKKISEQTVAVTILLKGGHERRVKLDARDPSLLSLLEAVAKRTDDKTKATVFNLQMEDGEGSLVFAAADVIALSTIPAISIDFQIENPEFEFSRVVKKNCFSSKTVAALLRYVEKRSKEFKPSRVIDDRKRMSVRSKARESSSLNDLGDFKEIFREQVVSDLPTVLEQLQIPSFPISEIECQITAHNNGHYYERHLDSGSTLNSRIVTFVYYFYNEPRSFKGGALRFYKGILENEVYRCGNPSIDLDPVNNTMVYFPSACFHEVLPVDCSSGKFKDSRFAVNGWVRMAE
jgi:SM-20-related protein